MEENSIFGKALARAIKRKGHTQAEFAEKLGIPLDTLRNYIKGQSLPSIKLYFQMDRLLDLGPMSSLFGWEEGAERDE